MKRLSKVVAVFTLILGLGITSVAQAKQLIVAHDTNFKPFEFRDESGNYTGFDIELWQEIAKRANLDYQFQPMDFNGIIPALQTNNVDAAIAGCLVIASKVPSAASIKTLDNHSAISWFPKTWNVVL